MRFSTTFFVSAFAAMASAQNMFTMTTLPTSIAVGTTFNITWQATTPGTVSLLLVQAASPGSTLVHEVSTIAANITNSGSFAWIPSSQTPKGDGYAIEIIDDTNPFITNYSGQFAIDSDTTASSASPSSTGSVSAGTTVSPTASSFNNSSTTGSAASGASSTTGSGSSSTAKAATTLSTVTSSGSDSSQTSGSSSPSATAKIAGAATESARSGLGLLAALGVAVLFL